MHKLIAATAAVAMLASQTSALGSPSCSGCNLVQEGGFGQSLIGQTVYYAPLGSNIPVTVERIDWASSQIYWRLQWQRRLGRCPGLLQPPGGQRAPR